MRLVKCINTKDYSERNVHLTIDNHYIVLEEKKNGYKYYIQNDTGNFAWYRNYRFKDLTRLNKLKRILK